jgi:hypothetical protein
VQGFSRKNMQNTFAAPTRMAEGRECAWNGALSGPVAADLLNSIEGEARAVALMLAAIARRPGSRNFHSNFRSQSND